MKTLNLKKIILCIIFSIGIIFSFSLINFIFQDYNKWVDVNMIVHPLLKNLQPIVQGIVLSIFIYIELLIIKQVNFTTIKINYYALLISVILILELCFFKIFVLQQLGYEITSTILFFSIFSSIDIT